MSTSKSLKPAFVEFVPDELEPGVLYVSMEFATCVHLCACGCGHKVVTPLAPHRKLGWTLAYNGEGISLSPSIGNWSFPCQSHYWVRDGEISWDVRWTRSEIDQHRAAERGLLRPSVPSSADCCRTDTTDKRALRRPWWRLFRR